MFEFESRSCGRLVNAWLNDFFGGTIFLNGADAEINVLLVVKNKNKVVLFKFCMLIVGGLARVGMVAFGFELIRAGALQN